MNWGTKYYVYSLVAHVRTILRGLIALSDAENIPAAYILSRHVFEWTAQACYMNHELRNFYAQKQWSEAWTLLSASALGNLWVKRHGAKYAPSGDGFTDVGDVPDPIRISKAVTAYDQYQQQSLGTAEAKDNYGLLSEYSHPNSVCLQQYHTYDDNGRDVRFGDTVENSSPLPIVNWCLIDLLMFSDELLRMSGDTMVEPTVVALLKQIAKMAPKTKS